MDYTNVLVLMCADVAFFLPSLEGGGAERCMLTLARGMAGQNIPVSLIAARAEGVHVREARDAIQVVDLESSGVWKAIPSLVRHLRKERPAVLISALDNANLAALIAKRVALSRVHVVVTTHTVLSMAFRLYRPQVSWAMTRLLRHFYPRADRVVGVSKAVAADLSKVAGIPVESISVIYNPVDAHRIEALSQVAVDSPLFRSHEPPVVTAVGNLWRHKDHRTLVKAVGIARQERPLRLVILGEGPERDALQALVVKLNLGSEVHLPGFVANPYAWMARSAVFALSSRWEGLPTVLVEAMACGVTPVATDSPGGTSEILEGGRYGILTPVGDAQSMADALLHALDHPLHAADLQRRADDFSIERAVSRYVELVENLE